MKRMSIIIPVYNELDNLGFALFSIFKQNQIDNIEVIIVDDCSDCSYQKDIKLYKSLGIDIKYIKNKDNVGAGVSRQKGIDIATGEFIAFLDADDFITPNLYMEVTKNIKLYPEKEVFSWAIAVENFKLPQKGVFHLGSYAVKKDFLIRNNIRFHDNLRLFEDLYFVNLILDIAIFENQFQMIHKVLYYYRNQNKNSTLHRCGLKKEELANIKNIATAQKTMWFLNHKPEILENRELIKSRFEQILKDGKIDE